jgi:hypothetical protein
MTSAVGAVGTQLLRSVEIYVVAITGPVLPPDRSGRSSSRRNGPVFSILRTLHNATDSTSFPFLPLR